MPDYVIKSGDCLSAIANRYGITVEALKKANNIANENNIIAGNTIKIPDGKGITVEHRQARVGDEQTRQAHAAERKKSVLEMMSIKRLQKTVLNRMEASKNETAAKLISAEMELKDVPIEGGKKFGKNFGNAEYWAEKIDKISSEFNFPKEIMVAKVSREVTFEKNLINGDQHGCMQIRPIAVRAMFPDAPGNWYDKYKELDEKLLNDILYKKDKNGKLVPKYSSCDELYEACKDDEISLKVGILYDKMQYAEALTAKKFGPKKVYPHISEIIAELKNKTITPQQNKINIQEMETKYNGSPDYGKGIVDALIRMGFDFKKQIIKRD